MIKNINNKINVKIFTTIIISALSLFSSISSAEDCSTIQCTYPGDESNCFSDLKIRQKHYDEMVSKINNAYKWINTHCVRKNYYKNKGSHQECRYDRASENWDCHTIQNDRLQYYVESCDGIDKPSYLTYTPDKDYHTGFSKTPSILLDLEINNIYFDDLYPKEFKKSETCNDLIKQKRFPYLRDKIKDISIYI